MSIKFAAVTRTTNYLPDPIYPAFHRLWIIFFLIKSIALFFPYLLYRALFKKTFHSP